MTPMTPSKPSAEPFSEALAYLEAGCQHFFEALRSERRALEDRDPEALIVAAGRKQAAAKQLKAAQDLAAEAAAKEGFEDSMNGYATWALARFEVDAALSKRFNAMLKLMGRCAQANELARQIIDARLATTDEALRVLLEDPKKGDPRYGQDGQRPGPGRGSSRGAA
jgi:flagellar biosynthesis/type III secretory pathway chaperone